MTAVAQLTDELTITPLQPTIGAEISGVDLSRPIPDTVRDQIKEALLAYKVVFFRDQDLNREQHEAFAGRFGPLYTHPSSDKLSDHSLAHRIAAVDEKKYEQLAAASPKDQYWDAYHTDTSWRLVPTWGAVLRAVDLPPVGGDTVWVDANLAYEGLPADVKARLDGLHVTHDFRSSLNAAGHDYPIVSHPIVRVHRETGNRTLWANFTMRPILLGLPEAESRELLTIVLNQYRKPAYQVRFKWAPGSVAFWDNRAAVHYAVKNYGDYPRLLERVLIADEPLWADL
jgi:alpha-ketoglutarate-dependent taurine dioxygenase